MSDAMDPFIWTEPAPLPDPTLVDFFTSSLPDSPPPVQLSPDTPSNSTHPWESELVTLQQQNAALQAKLADVPRLLEQLDRQKAELAAARRRLVAVETSRAALQDRLDRLDRTAKRPRVDNVRCFCGKKRDRACAISEWLDQFARVDVADLAPEVQSFIAILEEEKRHQTTDHVANALYNCLVHADEQRCESILRCIAAAVIMETAILPPIVDAVLNHIKSAFQQPHVDPVSTTTVVRVLLQGAVVGVWNKRASAELLASFIAMRREANDLLRLVLSINEKLVKEVLIDSIDGRDLNLLWGPSLQAVLNFFARPADTAFTGKPSSHEQFLSRWNDVRTTVEDLQDHASLRDAETALLLELSVRPSEICFEVAVRKALLEKVTAMVAQTEKMEKMFGLVTSLVAILRRDETEGMQKCIRSLANWLVYLSCMDDLAPRLAVKAANMAVEIVGELGREGEENDELQTGLVRFSQRELAEEDSKLVSERIRVFARQRNLAKEKDKEKDDSMPIV